jgi:hypothetical protein
MSRAVLIRRARRRAESAGAVMFIVAMTVAVLAAIGLFALSAASTEMRTSGYERQNAQTHYLSEYGVLGGAQEVSGTKAQLYVGLMVSKPDTGCVSLPGVYSPPSGVTVGPLSKACRRMGSGELAGWLGASTATPTSWATQVLEPYVSAAKPGSLGSAPLTGDFYVELTDPKQTAPPAGFDLKLGLCFVQLTVSSTGMTQPLLAAGGSPGEMAQYGGEGIEAARSRIIGGPIRCPQ